MAPGKKIAFPKTTNIHVHRGSKSRVGELVHARTTALKIVSRSLITHSIRRPTRTQSLWERICQSTLSGPTRAGQSRGATSQLFVSGIHTLLPSPVIYEPPLHRLISASPFSKLYIVQRPSVLQHVWNEAPPKVLKSSAAAPSSLMQTGRFHAMVLAGTHQRPITEDQSYPFPYRKLSSAGSWQPAANSPVITGDAVGVANELALGLVLALGGALVGPSLEGPAFGSRRVFLTLLLAHMFPAAAGWGVWGTPKIHPCACDAS